MTDQEPLSIKQIGPYLHHEGEVSFTFAGRSICFNLQNKHERNYAAKMLLNLQYPQSDIDSLLFA